MVQHFHGRAARAQPLAPPELTRRRRPAAITSPWIQASRSSLRDKSRLLFVMNARLRLSLPQSGGNGCFRAPKEGRAAIRSLNEMRRMQRDFFTSSARFGGSVLIERLASAVVFILAREL
jgi:hypothetical protein